MPVQDSRHLFRHLILLVSLLTLILVVTGCSGGGTINLSTNNSPIIGGELFIKSVEPSNGNAGNVVDIIGGTFIQPKVYFDNDRIAQILSVSSEKITVLVPPPRNGKADRVNIVVDVAGMKFTKLDAFSYIEGDCPEPPVVSGSTPNEVGAGDRFEILGEHFSSDSLFYVDVYPLEVIQIEDSQSAEVVMPDLSSVCGASRCGFDITAQVSSCYGFLADGITYTDEDANLRVDSITPNKGFAGIQATIKGDGFVNSEVYFASNRAQIISENSQQLVVVVPPSADDDAVTVDLVIKVLKDSVTLVDAFTYDTDDDCAPPPVINSVNPYQVGENQRVTVKGAEFSQETLFFFGGAVADVDKIMSDTEVDLFIPDLDYDCHDTVNGCSYQATAQNGACTGELDNAINYTPIDSDGDGISDEDEEKAGCDPYATDTDGDGIPDRIEFPLKGKCDHSNIDDDPALDVDDCRPADPTIYPGASEIPGDGIDQDCRQNICDPLPSNHECYNNVFGIDAFHVAVQIPDKTFGSLSPNWYCGRLDIQPNTQRDQDGNIDWWKGAVGNVHAVRIKDVEITEDQDYVDGAFAYELDAPPSLSTKHPECGPILAVWEKDPNRSRLEGEKDLGNFSVGQNHDYCRFIDVVENRVSIFATSEKSGELFIHHDMYGFACSGSGGIDNGGGNGDQGSWQYIDDRQDSCLYSE